MTILVAPLRGDDRVCPRALTYRFLSHQEVCAMRQGAWQSCLDNAGRITRVKITSVKTYKSSPRVHVGWKFGLYQYGYVDMLPEQTQDFFIEILDQGRGCLAYQRVMHKRGRFEEDCYIIDIHEDDGQVIGQRYNTMTKATNSVLHLTGNLWQDL